MQQSLERRFWPRVTLWDEQAESMQYGAKIGEHL